MCETQDFRHESDAFPDGWRQFDQRLRLARITSGAENIAYRTLGKDRRQWAQAVVGGWIKSAEHRKNILNPAYRYIGIGIAPCKHGICYATQVFSPEIGRKPDRGNNFASRLLR